MGKSPLPLDRASLGQDLCLFYSHLLSGSWPREKLGLVPGRIGWELGSGTFTEWLLKRRLSVAKVCADDWAIAQRVECAPSNSEALGSMASNT